MKQNTRKRVIISTSIFIVVVLGGLFAYNWNLYQRNQQLYSECKEDGCLRIYGNVQQDLFIDPSYLMNNSFPQIENASYHILNSFHNTEDMYISGVALWEIFTQTQILGDNATYVRFEADDGYQTYFLPIRILRAHPDKVVIMTHIDGMPMLSKEEGGEGPLRIAVYLDVIANDTEVQDTFAQYFQTFVHNSKFSVKYLNAIYVL